MALDPSSDITRWVVCLVVLCVISHTLYRREIFSTTTHLLQHTRPRLPRVGTIPPVMYKTGPLAHEDLPTAVQDLFRRTVLENPWLHIVYISDDQARRFVEARCEPHVVRTYRRLRPGAYRADLLRYCLMYELGGIYGDLTQQYVVPLDQLVDIHHDRLVLVRDIPFCGITGARKERLWTY